MDDAIKEFKNYTNKYLDLGFKMGLKVRHTIRVMNLCEQIAKSLDLNEEDIFVAKLCGLLHDIGRFEQYKRFKTFKDNESIDHGDLGVEILQNNNYLRKYIKEDKYDNIILKSIKYHNKYKIDDNLSEREKLFCQITRDADKIDILYLYINGEIEINEINEAFTENVFNSLLEGKQISKTIRLNKADNLSISLGFVFDINYQESFKILRDNNYYDTIIDKFISKSNNPLFKEQLKEVSKKINNYIDEKLEAMI